MKPALTAEEWTVRYIVTESRGAWVSGDGAEWLGYDDTERLTWKGREHAVAALALHGQPFGFTREDLRGLRQSIIALETDATAFGVDNTQYAESLRSTADRIEALLPPE